MLLKLSQCRIIWYLLAGFKTIILCSVHSIRFVKYVFFAKIWFVKTSTGIVKYESRVVKLNSGELDSSSLSVLAANLFLITVLGIDIQNLLLRSLVFGLL